MAQEQTLSGSRKRLHWNDSLVDRDTPIEIDPAALATQPDPHDALRYIGHHYIEISRVTKIARGVGLALFLPSVFLGVVLLALGGAALFVDVSFLFVVVAALASCSMFFFAVSGARVDWTMPLDQPLRFNRANRRVYIFDFNYSQMKPLSNTAWGVETKIYRWEQIQAKIKRQAVPLGRGVATVDATVLVVRDRESGEEIDEINLTGFQSHRLVGHQLWAYIRQYMRKVRIICPNFRYEVARSISRRACSRIREYWSRAGEGKTTGPNSRVFSA